MHQAGSDALLTANCFFKLREMSPGDDLDYYHNIIYGLNRYPQSNNYFN